MLVALAIGAVTLGRAISHARDTCAGVEFRRAETSSRAAKMRKPRSLRRSPSLRRARSCGNLPWNGICPVRKPLARGEIRDDADTFLGADPLEVPARTGAVVEVVVGLQTLVAGPAVAAAHAQRFGEDGRRCNWMRRWRAPACGSAANRPPRFSSALPHRRGGD